MTLVLLGNGVPHYVLCFILITTVVYILWYSSGFGRSMNVNMLKSLICIHG